MELLDDALTTIEKVCRELDLDHLSLTDQQEEDIILSINVATEKIAAYCNRSSFSFQEYTHTVEVLGDKLVLPVYPVTEIIEIDPSIDFDEDFQQLDKGIVFLDDPGEGLHKVTYTAGWILPGNVERNLPYTIEMAAVKLSSRGYLSIGAVYKEEQIKSEKSFDYSYTLQDYEEKTSNMSTIKLSSQYKRLLDKWVIQC